MIETEEIISCMMIEIEIGIIIVEVVVLTIVETEMEIETDIDDLLHIDMIISMVEMLTCDQMMI